MNAEPDAEVNRQLNARSEELEQALWNCRFALIQSVHTVSSVAAHRDAFTAQHQRRVAELSVAIGRRVGLDVERLEGLYLGALVHDIGKIAIPWEILSKPAALSAAERALMRTHAQVGRDIFAPAILPWPIQEIILQHHERLDGSGYPAGLSGENIVLEARIVAVADVFESMCAQRPYRSALSVETAMGELEQGAGIKFDADAVRVLRALVEGVNRSITALWDRLAAEVQSEIGRVRLSE